MKTSTKANIYKNIVCASIGLLVLFTTSIFVAKGSLQTTINSLIDSATILKEYFWVDLALSIPPGALFPET